MDSGELEKNLLYRERSREMLERYQYALGHVWSDAMMAQAHELLGNLNAARGYAERAARAARSMEQVWHTTYVLLMLANVKIPAGEWDEAAALIEEGRAIAAEYGDLQGLSMAREASGELRLLQGDPHSIVDTYESAGFASFEWERWVLATAYLQIGDEESATRIVESMLQGEGLAEAAGFRIRGMIATQRGNRDEAERDLLQALKVARRQKYRQEEGLALHELGVMLAASGDRDGARERFGEALRLFRDMGAQAYADRTERSLSGLLSG
jgi:tetratricopeptide (TPR) repeat protein